MTDEERFGILEKRLLALGILVADYSPAEVLEMLLDKLDELKKPKIII